MTKKEINKMIRMTVKFFIAVMIFTGAISIEIASLKIMKTGSQLSVIRDNMIWYNEQHVKTDQMTEDYNQEKQRRENLQASDDVVVSFYSNQIGFVRLLIFLGAIGVALVILFSVIYGIAWYIHVKNRKKHKGKKAA